MEEPLAEALFELRKRAADRGQRLPERPGSGGQAPALDDPGKDQHGSKPVYRHYSVIVNSDFTLEVILYLCAIT